LNNSLSNENQKNKKGNNNQKKNLKKEDKSNNNKDSHMNKNILNMFGNKNKITSNVVNGLKQIHTLDNSINSNNTINNNFSNIALKHTFDNTINKHTGIINNNNDNINKNNNNNQLYKSNLSGLDIVMNDGCINQTFIIEKNLNNNSISFNPNNSNFTKNDKVEKITDKEVKKECYFKITEYENDNNLNSNSRNPNKFKTNNISNININNIKINNNVNNVFNPKSFITETFNSTQSNNDSMKKTGNTGNKDKGNHIFNSVMKSFQSDLKLKEMVNIVTSNSNKQLDYNILGNFKLYIYKLYN
jgi:hypothetical protein